MTCVEFVELVTNDQQLEEVTRAERVAMVRHYIVCEQCAAFLDAGIDGEPPLTDDEAEFIKNLARNDAKDPEV